MTSKKTVTLFVPAYRLSGALDACLAGFGSVEVSEVTKQRCVNFHLKVQVRCNNETDSDYIEELVQKFDAQVVDEMLEFENVDLLDQQVSDLMQKVSKQNIEVRQKVAATIMHYCTITTEVKSDDNNTFYIETELEID